MTASHLRMRSTTQPSMRCPSTVPRGPHASVAFEARRTTRGFSASSLASASPWKMTASDSVSLTFFTSKRIFSSPSAMKALVWPT